MLLSTAEDLAKFVEELKRETDRGLSLVAAALIDDRLTETLRSFFCEVQSTAKLLDDGSAPLSSFSSRTEACYALGLIDEFEYNEIGLIRKVRNEFAHQKHGMSFSSPRIQGLCSTLKSDLPKDAGYPLQDPRFRFTNAVVVLALRLYHRPDWVALERRKPKTWVDESATKWRSVGDELPSLGMPVVVMSKPRN
ncbi:transcriptional regulator [Herbaspirillum huttiense]|uniref:MltR family transcriptional regulator n=1 Tax=Herbaspirillum huttiense TaxID=863372 RepID=UPI0010649B2C|nr:MltR family transcriptional regulator [Herbaspirillum huttiense]QBP73857.1 transcriptional regulator [Herbaspirillum huttiense]